MPLPIETVLPQIHHALASHRFCIVTAATGSGKTTLVPLAILEQKPDWLGHKKILMLEPRRLAARLAADYMSQQLGEKTGHTVGYQIRFARNISRHTKIEVITEGLLTRRLQQDPELSEVGLIIFDEFHERSLASDLAFTLCLDVIGSLRPDLRLLIMSATLDTEQLQKKLNNCPLVTGTGSSFPVKTHYLPPRAGTDSNRPDHIADTVYRAIRQVAGDHNGDILVFLPGIGEIKRVQRKLAAACQDNRVICPLHGSQKPKEQQQAILPDVKGRQRIILATTIAETSLTIKGISVVIDCGWKRISRFDANSGLDRLDTVRVSKASAQQRAGRAGRLGPGTCYRLFSQSTEMGFQEFDSPEINQADLSSLVLELANWGVHSPEQLTWLEPPPADSFDKGKKLLQDLKALDTKGRITPSGRMMSNLPLHPRLARMVCDSGSCNLATAIQLAALLSERDILHANADADLENRLYCLHRFQRQGASAVNGMGGNPAHCRKILQISDQLSSIMARQTLPPGRPRSVGALLALAYPDRVAGKRSSGRGYKLVSGKGGFLHEHDPLAAQQWLVIASQNVTGRDGKIFLAASITRREIEEIFSSDLIRKKETLWDKTSGSVICRCGTWLGQLLILEKKIKNPQPDDIVQALLTGIREQGLSCLNWTPEAKSLCTRVNSLRQWQPETEWPDFSQQALEQSLEIWLGPYLTGIKNIKDCSRLNLTEILRARLDYKQQQALKQDAPTHLRVPSGSRIKLQYQNKKPPILAVRLQELFGLAETPSICRGRIKVILHLLSPARRPVQITQDLKGFWNSSYFEVRKEMKGRYPKHHWPEKPWQATPTRTIQRRSKHK